MTISLNLPKEIEDVLRRRGSDPGKIVLDAALVDLYRRHEITHHQLATALGLGRLAVDEVLKRHNVPLDISVEELREEVASLRRDRGR
ncbi:hypothetical protein PHYC_03783 [Phycisphaerales bacterium]|nr:hypothetical protein PHYC_03783 [Phycisphaerales bacterium]